MGRTVQTRPAHRAGCVRRCGACLRRSRFRGSSRPCRCWRGSASGERLCPSAGLADRILSFCFLPSFSSSSSFVLLSFLVCSFLSCVLPFSLVPSPFSLLPSPLTGERERTQPLALQGPAQALLHF